MHLGAADTTSPLKYSSVLPAIYIRSTAGTPFTTPVSGTSAAAAVKVREEYVRPAINSVRPNTKHCCPNTENLPYKNCSLNPQHSSLLGRFSVDQWNTPKRHCSTNRMGIAEGAAVVWRTQVGIGSRCEAGSGWQLQQ